MGNGASLRHTPLHLLIGEDCMAVNGISAIFPDTEWRPTHYVKVDDSAFDSLTWQEQVEPMLYARCLLWSKFDVGSLPNVTYVERCKRHHAYMADNYQKRVQSWHLPELCTAINSLSLMAQWAVLLGYDEIYLLGCDLNFTDGHDDHFVEDYYPTVDSGYQERSNTNALYAHELIKRCCPVPVYNATLGGELEVYPRVDLRKVLNGEMASA